MKLAEALAERADCQKRIQELKKRLGRSAKVQEGEAPPEKPEALLEELGRTLERFKDLVQAINRVNAATQFGGGKTLSDALAERDVVGLERDILAALAEAASIRQDRYSRSEVRFVPTVAAPEIQKRVDQLSKRYRELDTHIQQLNWNVEVG
jgi:hypothetical protein